MSRGMMSCRIVSTLTDEPALIPTHVAAGHSSDEAAGGVALTKTAANQVVEVGATSSRPARHEVLLITCFSSTIGGRWLPLDKPSLGRAVRAVEGTGQRAAGAHCMLTGNAC